METKLLHAAAERTYAVVFDDGEEVIDGLTAFAAEEQVTAARLTAIGAFRSATLGYFDMEEKDYREIPVDTQVEVLSLVGNIAVHREKNEPKVHAHVVVGLPDGTTRGGHLLEARVRPTLEVLVVESPEHLQREVDPDTGLALIR